MSVSVTLKSYFYEVLIPSSQKNTSSPIEDILHHVSISFMKKLALYKCFNPRTHTGCDYRNAIENGASEVSIHAPTRGATIFDLRKFISVQTFQSTHPHGVRHTVTFGGNEEILFQSTHPHGVRPFWQLFHCLNTDIVSIHAPTRGATCNLHQSRYYQVVSIHAPTRGATDIHSSIGYTIKFQSTHPHGVRLVSGSCR